MNKLFQILSACAAIMFLDASSVAQSRVLTVDNNPGAIAMFSNAQAAYAAADAGDTLLLTGSPFHYGDLALVKRINIVGPGYGLAENRIPGMTFHTAGISFVVENSGASGSTFTGLSVGGLLYPQRADDFVFERCQIRFDSGANTFSGRVTLRSCWMAHGFHLAISGSTLRNCFIASWYAFDLGTTAVNCVFLDPNALSASSNAGAHPQSSISNSIFVGDRSSLQFAERMQGSITYCLATSVGGGANYLPQGGGNINGAEQSAVFVGAGSFDGMYQLAPDSPARGSGFNGVDMGVFGGATPYVLSGVPNRPRITRFVLPAAVTSSSGLRFEVDARAF